MSLHAMFPTMLVLDLDATNTIPAPDFYCLILCKRWNIQCVPEHLAAVRSRGEAASPISAFSCDSAFNSSLAASPKCQISVFDLGALADSLNWGILCPEPNVPACYLVEMRTSHGFRIRLTVSGGRDHSGALQYALQVLTAKMMDGGTIIITEIILLYDWNPQTDP